MGVKKEKDLFLQGYNEMLRSIEPKAIICYCDPFPEIKGHVIKVDYAKINNLSYKKTFYGFVDNSCYKAQAEIDAKLFYVAFQMMQGGRWMERRGVMGSYYVEAG